MRVRLGKAHIMCGDEHCCWIMQAAKPKEGKPDGRRMGGYVPVFRMAAGGYASKEINPPGVKGISRLAGGAAGLVEEVRPWKPGFPGAKQ